MATSDADISAGLTVTIGSQGSKCCVAPAVLNLIERRMQRVERGIWKDKNDPSNRDRTSDLEMH